MTNTEGAELGRRAARALAQVGTGSCRLEPGLTGAEFARIEQEYGFTFADDHRAFLAEGLPLDPVPADGFAARAEWPDWRDGDPAVLRRKLAWPIEGVLFDVERNRFWRGEWGPRPPELDQALAAARERLTAAPVMVPVFSHRYLPSGQGVHGRAVLSMHQADIIVYGVDLVDYIGREFGGQRPDRAGVDWESVLPAVWIDLVS